MGETSGPDARPAHIGSREARDVRFASQPTIAPMSARELLHYDAAMAVAEERYPLLPADAPEWEQRLRVRLRMAYHAVILDGWSDHEHQRRMAAITASIRHIRRDRPSPGNRAIRTIRVVP